MLLVHLRIAPRGGAASWAPPTTWQSDRHVPASLSLSLQLFHLRFLPPPPPPCRRMWALLQAHAECAPPPTAPCRAAASCASCGATRRRAVEEKRRAASPRHAAAAGPGLTNEPLAAPATAPRWRRGRRRGGSWRRRRRCTGAPAQRCCSCLPAAAAKPARCVPEQQLRAAQRCASAARPDPARRSQALRPALTH
jgi:hypothetical protein